VAKEPEKIGNVILKTLSRMGFTKRLQKQSAVIKWKEIVGDTIAAETEALRIDGNTLVVKVHQAAWRQQLTYLKEGLLVKLKAELGEDSIEDIRFI
jgi:predicted nucleic acid-binding Zn ribbon protein